MNYSIKIPVIIVLLICLTLWISSCKKDSASSTTVPPITFNSNLTYGSVSDIDDNIYKTIQIDSQIWMAENLKVTKYRDGSTISNVTDKTEWAALTTGAYCWHDNDTSNKSTYGALYNYYAVEDSRNLCPTGWHVPSDTEWTTLTTFLGGDSIAGGKLKETGTNHWSSPNSGATNEIGFAALPCGYHSYNGSYLYIGSYGYLWSSTEYSASSARFRVVYYSSTYVYRNYNDKKNGFSVRCVRDF